MSRISQPTPDHRRPQPLVPSPNQPQVPALCTPARRATTRQRKRPGGGSCCGRGILRAARRQPARPNCGPALPNPSGHTRASPHQPPLKPACPVATRSRVDRAVRRPPQQARKWPETTTFSHRERGRDSSPHLAGGGVRPMPLLRRNTLSLRCTLAKSLISFITYTLLLCA